MHRLAQSLGILELAEEVGLLHIEGSNLGGEHFLQSLRIRLAVLHRHHTQLVTGTVAVSAYGVDGVGMGRAGDKGHPAPAVTAHGGSLGGGGSSVIHGGVGHIHARQLADHGLVLKDRLQKALAHFRLIGRIRREELLLGGNILDDGGDVVVVGACAAKHRGIHPVLLRHGGHGAADIQLAHPVGDLQRLMQEHLLRHIPKKLPCAGNAHGTEHFLPLRPGRGNIAAHISPPRCKRPRRRRRPAAPRCRPHSPP